VYDAIVSAFKGTGFFIDPSVVCRAFFVTNLVGITPINALENILGKSLGQPVAEQAQKAMISISSERFTPEKYEETISWMVKSGLVTVENHLVRREIIYHQVHIYYSFVLLLHNYSNQ
jgi:hypothetical protein